MCTHLHLNTRLFAPNSSVTAHTSHTKIGVHTRARNRQAADHQLICFGCTGYLFCLEQPTVN
jgi:hypothetical protein